MKKKLRILIADDHPLMRRALQTAVIAEPDIEVVGLARNGEEAQRLIVETNPDIILVDWLMSFGEAKNIRTIHSEHPDLKILVVTSLEDGQIITEAIEAGALGYITKEVDHKKLLEAIRIVAAGDPFLPPKIMTRMLAFMQQREERKIRKTSEDEVTVSLTNREKELFNLLAEGLTNLEIAQKLSISDVTVRVHLYNIMKKYKFSSRSEAIVHAVRALGESA